jgi:hypothetical protein
MDPGISTIALTNKGTFFTLYLLVYHRPSYDEWKITNIEIYADAEHTLLLADDVHPAMLGPWRERDFYEALNEAVEEKRALTLPSAAEARLDDEAASAEEGRCSMLGIDP